jgi:hypothetical protein
MGPILGKEEEEGLIIKSYSIKPLLLFPSSDDAGRATWSH